MKICRDIAIKFKLQAINATLSLGLSRDDTAKIFGISTLTLSNWMNDFYRHGIEGLIEKQKTGRKPLLNDRQLSLICYFLENPDKYINNTIYQNQYRVVKNTAKADLL